MDRERIRKALAQTYCMDRHSHKVLDPDLIEDMTDRIIAEECDDDALGIAYKKGFEDGKAKIIAEEGCTCKEPKKKKL